MHRGGKTQNQNLFGRKGGINYRGVFPGLKGAIEVPINAFTGHGEKNRATAARN